jgi:hypothetical protein
MILRTLFLFCFLTCAHAANQPPVLNPIGNQSIPTGSKLEFSIHADNPEKELFSYGTGSEVPILFWTSQPVRPDQTILATCGGTNPDSSAELARLSDDAPGSPLAPKSWPSTWTHLTPQSASARSLFVTVPDHWSDGVYALRLKTGSATGPVRMVNAPDPWFVQGDKGDTATPGGFFIVAGNCLEITGGTGPKIALVRDASVVKTITNPVRMTTSTGYALRYAVPADTPEGNYTLYVHNGRGGPAAWVRYSGHALDAIETVTVRSFDPWPTQIFPVAAPVGNDDDAILKTALDAAAANGGGVVLMPAGTYQLTQAVLIPARVTLKGAGRTQTFLLWDNNPRASNPTLPGLVMNRNYGQDEPFGLEDMTVEITNPSYWGAVAYKGFTRSPSTFQRLTLKAPRLDTTTEDNMPFGIYLRRASNLHIHDVHVESSKGIYGREHVSHIRITGSTVIWNNFGFKFSGKNHNLIVDGNHIRVSGPTRTHTSLGLTPFHASDGPFNRDLLWSNNLVDAEEGHEDHFSGYTADGADGIYRGPVRSTTGVSMTLAGLTATTGHDGNPVSYNWKGAVAMILDGRGAGQWRYLQSATQGTSTVSIDRPWDIQPDQSSIVSLVHMMGRYLMIDNDYVRDGGHDDYYIATDSIKVGNKFGVTGRTFTATNWTGRHYQGTLPGWHIQFLDNTFVRDAPALIKSMVNNTPESTYDGMVLAGHVYRNNADLSPGIGPSTIQFRTMEGRACDALFEGNRIDLISFRQNAENMDVEGILIRQNRIPGTMNPTPIQPEIPIPGVTLVP